MDSIHSWQHGNGSVHSHYFEALFLEHALFPRGDALTFHKPMDVAEADEEPLVV